MSIYTVIRGHIIDAVKEEIASGRLPSDVSTNSITVEPPKDVSHGDISTNAAMVIASAAKVPPKLLAENLIKHLEALREITSAEIAGPGFINMFISINSWHDTIRQVLKNGISYGDNNLGNGRKINIEYVSANPTGPLHVGHARGAVFGDALASLLNKSGFKVTKEYYINDYGGQVESLAHALHYRYLEVYGEKTQKEIDEAIESGRLEYGGKYLKKVAQDLVEKDGDKWLKCKKQEWLEPLKKFSVDKMLEQIRSDLESLGVCHDVYISESSLVNNGCVEKAISVLDGEELLYTGVLDPPKGKIPEDWEPRPQLLFRSSKFGDDVDRPVKKSDGSWTYFASDLAYHQNKFNRGFSEMINVWGADHSGYIKRITAGVEALSNGKGRIDIKLCQLVKLFDAGKQFKMSKRSGNFVTVKDLVDTVGKDVVRFIMLTRKNDVALDFDFTKVTEKTRENPVFYVQYAIARIKSIFRHVSSELKSLDVSDDKLSDADLNLCSSESETHLMKLLATWPRVVEAAAQAHEPHRIAFYLYDLASYFHALWNQGNDNSELRFFTPDNIDRTISRLALIRSVGIVISSGLKVLEVTPVEEMR